MIHKWVQETENKFPNIAIDKYVIMPDHLHLIVTIKERHAGRSLPDVMRFFKTMTTNDYIRGVKDGTLTPFDGKLWQKSYYDHVIRNQQDYNEIWQYIENNPTKWIMITKNRRERPACRSEIIHNQRERHIGRSLHLCPVGNGLCAIPILRRSI